LNISSSPTCVKHYISDDMTVLYYYKQIEGSVDDGSGRSEGEEEFVEDDAYWEYDESSPTPRPPSTGKDRKATMLRLRSFDQASAGRGAPILRKSVSHTTRAPSRRHSFKPTTQTTT
jgi:hypothetical protein